MKSYGAMVFLKEVSSQYGFQAYLFEELEPYNKQIAAEAYEKWLKKNWKWQRRIFQKVESIRWKKFRNILIEYVSNELCFENEK